LRAQGFDTVGCSGTEAALAALRRQPADLLLADPTMTGTDGDSLLQAARALDPTLVDIAVIDAGGSASAAEAMRSGAFDCIVAPFEPSAVAPVLARALEVRRLRVRNAALELRMREHATELEAADRELDAFTRTASHDLRAPLNTVLGFSSLLVQDFSGQLAAQQRAWLVEIERAGRQMGRLIDDLMRLSRLGRQAPNLQWTDMTALAREVADELVAPLERPALRLQIDALPPACADAALVRQALAQLLSNALKFTRQVEAGHVHVGHLARPGAPAAYFVRDNGAGFDMALAGKLFQAFMRLHRSDQFEGSGVGLSIVQRIVRAHGGRVWAEAAPGRGATFYFTLEAGAAASRT
jgi:light-regulated signal transduction histidine kinase (bacteriophytochrome)